MKMNRAQIIYEGRRMIGVIAGALLYAIGINLFTVPAGLYSGGVMGMSQVIRTLMIEYTSLPIQNFDIAGVIYYLINIPIFVVAYQRIGKKFFVKTVLFTTCTTIFLSAIPITAVMEWDVLAASIIGGIISGCGIGLTLRMGASSGGLDVIGILLIRWKQSAGVGQVNLMVNAALYAVCFFLFDVPTVVYSLIYAGVTSVATDKMHSQNINVEVTVITRKANKEMMDEVFSQIDRGITKWQTVGAYTHEKSEILYILMSKYEVNRFKNIIHKYDPNAFIVVNEGVHVVGNYLKKL